MRRWLTVASVAIGLVTAGMALAQSTGCCITENQTSCQPNKFRIDCDRFYSSGNSGGNFYEGTSCDLVPFCVVLGKCEKASAPTDCRNLKRWECDQLSGQGYNFFANQTCGGIAESGRCCADPPSARQPTCTEGLDRNECSIRQGIYYTSRCYAVAHCPQARSGYAGQVVGSCTLPDGTCTNSLSVEDCTKRQGKFALNEFCPLRFTPNVPIPDLFEGEQQVSGTLFARYLGAFYVYFIGVVGILAVVTMMWGGYHYIVSAGNPQKMNQGKEIISGAVIGLTLALTSFLLLRLINPALVNFQGILPSFIGQILQSDEQGGAPTKPDVATKADISTATLNSILQRVKQNNYHQMVLAEAGNDREVAYRALSILFIESSGNASAISPAPAYGLMQLLPDTAAECGVKSTGELLVAGLNIRAGVCYLKKLIENPCPTYGESERQRNISCRAGEVCKKNDYQFVYAAYNGGRGANYCSSTCLGSTWWQCTGNPRYQETRVYVQKAQIVYDWLTDQKVY